MTIDRLVIPVKTGIKCPASISRKRTFLAEFHIEPYYFIKIDIQNKGILYKNKSIIDIKTEGVDFFTQKNPLFTGSP